MLAPQPTGTAAIPGGIFANHGDRLPTSQRPLKAGGHGASFAFSPRLKNGNFMERALRRRGVPAAQLPGSFN